MLQEGAEVWLGRPVLPTEDKDVGHSLETACIQSIYEEVPLEIPSSIRVERMARSHVVRGARLDFFHKMATTMKCSRLASILCRMSF